MMRRPVRVQKKEAAMSQTDPLNETSETLQRSDRRAFFTTALGAAAVGAGALTLATPAAAQTAFNELDASNFALNLEYLQANFFAVATGGAVLGSADISGSGTAGAATGARAVTFTDSALASMAREMAADALAHVKFLRASATTTYVVAQPAIDLGATPSGAFSSLARAAGLVGGGVAFDPYASENNFLLAAFMLKDVSVTTYAGVLNYVSTLTFAEAVAGLMTVEAHHAATLRAALYRRGVATPSLIDATESISAARDTYDGATTDLDQGVRPGASAGGAVVANIAPLDSNGLAFTRTPQQVLNILYLNAGVSATTGGFFPAGLNGTIKSTAPAPTPTPTPTPSASATPRG
jgi:hypothetical protein